MLTRVKFSIVIASTLLTALLVIGAVMGQSSSTDGAYRQLSVYTEVLSRIKSEYVEEPDIKVVTRGALQGLLESLDPYSSYLSAEHYKEYQNRKAHQEAGVGLVISKRFGVVVILAAVAGSPAAKAGLQSWDLLEAVDGRSTRELPMPLVQALLSGTPGSAVRLVVRRSRRAEEPQDITLTRTSAAMPAVTHKLLPDRVGYVDVDVLTTGKAAEVARAVRELEALGAERLVLDLRNNALGEQQEGINLANLFVADGLLAYLQGQKHSKKDFQAESGRAISKLPLVVVTNRATAGAAELAVAAILDRQRGQVVGERTFGLGAIQRTITIEDGSAVILSIAKYYRPSGKAIQEGGVNPTLLASEPEPGAGDEDEPAPRSPERRLEDDAVLKKAIEVAKGASARA